MPFAPAPRTAALLAGLALAVAACGDAGPREGVTTSSAGDVAPTFPNDQAAFDYFVGKGLTTFQAAGIVGNLDQESGVSPTSVQSGGPGRGIAQWSAGGRWDSDGNDNVLWYASKEGESATSLTLQLEFIWYELTTFSGYGLAALRASTNVTAATIAFETDFEGCGECDQSTRISYAEAALAAYGAIPYAATFVAQSFPLASTTLTMEEGQVIPSYIELKNTGTRAWDSSTRIGTTQPRDRVSVFADATWVADNRPAAVSGTVAPGATYKFTFDLAAPMTPGTYAEYFGVLEEGVAWFGDPGQGGPPDDDLEVKILVVAKGAPPDAGSSEGGSSEAGSSDEAGSAEAGSSRPPRGKDAGASATEDGSAPLEGDADPEAGGDRETAGASSGCAVAPLAKSGGDGLGMLLIWGLAGGSLARRRRSRIS